MWGRHSCLGPCKAGHHTTTPTQHGKIRACAIGCAVIPNQLFINEKFAAAKAGRQDLIQAVNDL
jgi:hypothetical protein